MVKITIMRIYLETGTALTIGMQKHIWNALIYP